MCISLPGGLVRKAKLACCELGGPEAIACTSKLKSVKDGQTVESDTRSPQTKEEKLQSNGRRRQGKARKAALFTGKTFSCSEQVPGKVFTAYQ